MTFRIAAVSTDAVSLFPLTRDSRIDVTWLVPDPDTVVAPDGVTVSSSAESGADALVVFGGTARSQDATIARFARRREMTPVFVQTGRPEHGDAGALEPFERVVATTPAGFVEYKAAGAEPTLAADPRLDEVPEVIGCTADTVLVYAPISRDLADGGTELARLVETIGKEAAVMVDAGGWADAHAWGAYAQAPIDLEEELSRAGAVIGYPDAPLHLADAFGIPVFHLSTQVGLQDRAAELGLTSTPLRASTDFLDWWRNAPVVTSRSKDTGELLSVADAIIGRHA